MKRIGIFLFILAFSVACYAKETVSLSKNQVPQGESVELIFTSDTPITTAPVLVSLERDFTIAGQQTRTLSSIVNGDISENYQLIYNLLPRKVGKLTLEGLSLNDTTFPPINLSVTKGDNIIQAGQRLKLTGMLSKNKMYQGESFVYTVQLFDPIGISDGEFMAPGLEKATIQQLGKDELFTKMLDGHPVQVFQRQYLITPEMTGTFTIKPSVFTGAVTVRRVGRKTPGELFEMGLLFDGLTGSQQQVFATADPITIEVLKKPEHWTGWWLPSFGVTLTEVYQIPDEIKIGSTIERTITLMAKGIQAEDLPQIIQPSGTGLNVYPSPEKRETQHTEETVTGILNVSVVLVPTESGIVTIPGITVPWFNTETGRREEASIPPKVITVQGEVLKAAIPPQPIVPVFSDTEAAGMGKMLWLALIGGIFIGCLLMGGIALILIKRRAQHAKKEKPLPDLYPFS